MVHLFHLFPNLVTIGNIILQNKTIIYCRNTRRYKRPSSTLAAISPSPAAMRINAPVTKKKMDILLAKSPSLNPTNLTLFRAGVTSEERALFLTTAPATKNPTPII